MARGDEVVQKIRVALTTEFGHGVSVSVVDRGAGTFAIVLSGVQTDASRQDEPAAVAGAVRDLVRPRFSREELETLARRRRTSVEEVERTLAADALRSRSARQPAVIDPLERR